MNLNSENLSKTKFFTSAANSFGAAFLSHFTVSMLDSTKRTTPLSVKVSK